MIRLITVLVLLSTFAFSTEQLAEECDAKSGESYYKLGDSYIMGKNGLKQDRQKAVELYKQACDCKYGEACNLLGFFANDSDVNLSLAYYDKGCEYGYEYSCTSAADINVKGVGREESGGRTDINVSKALEYYIKACDLNANNCTAVAHMYEKGYKDISKDITKAIEYYKKHCDSKFENVETCQKVGQAYAIGEVVPKDFKIASEYYAKACKHDKYGEICGRADLLGAIIDAGGNQLNIEVLTKSCDVKKNWFSCTVLASMYWKSKAFYDNFIPSEIPPKDLNKAQEYFAKACAVSQDVDASLSCSYAEDILEQIKAQETNATLADRNATNPR
jgi:TPR repeat protein